MPRATATTKQIIRRQRALLRGLGRELFQSETSAAWHCRREAERLGQVPPAWALTALADHAERVLDELPALAVTHGLPRSGLGQAAGRLFSAVRQVVVDRLVEPERSYRGTLLGIRHGIDVVSMTGHVAGCLNDDSLADWCKRWLDVRMPLARRVEDELPWFARHPLSAAQTVRGHLPEPRRPRAT
jgi:hypothetical protein